jgi:hypothetical protein
MGDLTLNDGVMQIEIDSPASFDTILVDDTASLGGDLQVLIGNFLPEATEEYEILTANVLTDTFANAASLVYVGSGTFDVTYTATSVLLSNFTLAPGLWGDYNDDGVVDAADYTVWRDAVELGGSLLNDLTPASVDEFDYGIWRMNFGLTDAGAAAQGTSNVPEPATAVLMFMGLVLLAAKWRRSGEGVIMPR